MIAPDDWIEIPAEFRGLDWRSAVAIYRRNLPHWRQAGATYFVTFRLFDSLPTHVVDESNAESKVWRKRFAGLGGARASPGVAEEYRRFQRSQQKRIEAVLDSAQGACVLEDPECRNLLGGALHHFSGQRYDLYSYAIMPNHVHVAVRPHEGADLEGLLQTWKGYSATEINRFLGRKGPLWQAENYDRIIRDEEHFRKVIRSIANNPVKAGISSERATTAVFVRTASTPPA